MESGVYIQNLHLYAGKAILGICSQRQKEELRGNACRPYLRTVPSAVRQRYNK